MLKEKDARRGSDPIGEVARPFVGSPSIFDPPEPFVTGPQRPEAPTLQRRVIGMKLESPSRTARTPAQVAPPAARPRPGSRRWSPGGPGRRRRAPAPPRREPGPSGWCRPPARRSPDPAGKRPTAPEVAQPLGLGPSLQEFGPRLLGPTQDEQDLVPPEAGGQPPPALRLRLQSYEGPKRRLGLGQAWLDPPAPLYLPRSNDLERPRYHRRAPGDGPARTATPRVAPQEGPAMTSARPPMKHLSAILGQRIPNDAGKLGMRESESPCRLLDQEAPLKQPIERLQGLVLGPGHDASRQLYVQIRPPRSPPLRAAPLSSPTTRSRRRAISP